MASTEEKLLTLLLSVEHLQHTAMEQQKAVADSLAVARETLRGYRDISDGVAKQVRDEVRNEVQKLDVAGLIGCLLYTSPSPRDYHQSRMPSSA